MPAPLFLRSVWRYGGNTTLNKTVMYWKSIVYAVHRRVAGLPRCVGDEQHLPMSVADAIRAVEKIVRDDAEQQGGNAGSKLKNVPTCSKLARDILPSIGEGSTAMYEDQVLLDGSFYLLPSSMWTDWVQPSISGGGIQSHGIKAAGRMNASKQQKRARIS